MVPFVFWCATALFLTCAYPISPPGEVKGLSSTFLANVLFIMSTCFLVIYTYHRGGSRKGTDKKTRIVKRMGYSWLCVVILAAFAAVNDLVRRGPEYITLSILVAYAALLGLLLSVFFILRYWHTQNKAREKNGA